MARHERQWEVLLKGGFADGYVSFCPTFPEALLFCWPCSHRECGGNCVAHMTFDLDAAAVNAVVYRRDALDKESMIAVYSLGDTRPAYEDEEFVYAGSQAEQGRDYSELDLEPA